MNSTAELINRVEYGAAVYSLYRMNRPLSYCAPDRRHVCQVSRIGQAPSLHMGINSPHPCEWIGDFTPMQYRDTAEYEAVSAAIAGAEAVR